jgi:hypothetical protein
MTMRPATQQLDIFADSRDVMLRNDVLAPLERRDAVAARTALERLAGEYPDDGALPAMGVLVLELERGSTAPFTEHGSLTGARRHLEDEVMPAARRALPAQVVRSWLVPCWRNGPRRSPFAAPMPTVMPHRCGCWQATRRLRAQRSRASNRGGASRHRSRG